jgi:hypothetical protein
MAAIYRYLIGLFHIRMIPMAYFARRHAWLCRLLNGGSPFGLNTGRGLYIGLNVQDERPAVRQSPRIGARLMNHSPDNFLAFTVPLENLLAVGLRERNIGVLAMVANLLLAHRFTPH